tara:strand:+ start:442 stop:768 length:327 start_codon:yes stop_codon:yes gene_type:complete
MTDFSKKFRKEREKFKKKNIRREKRGERALDPSEYTFKYKPKGTGLFGKRKKFTVETKSEKQKRLKRPAIQQQSTKSVEDVRGKNVAASPFGRGGITKGRDMFTQQYD